MTRAQVGCGLSVAGCSFVGGHQEAADHPMHCNCTRGRWIMLDHHPIVKMVALFNGGTKTNGFAFQNSEQWTQLQSIHESPNHPLLI